MSNSKSLGINLLLGFVGVAAVGGLTLGTVKIVQAVRRKNEYEGALTYEKPASIASEIYMALQNDMMFGWGTDEEAVFAAFNRIVSQTHFSQVQDSYRTLYQKDLNRDLQDELSSEDYQKIMNVLRTKPVK